MKHLLSIILILAFSLSFGQSTNISGLVIDENSKPVANAILLYGHPTSDTAYTDRQGRFEFHIQNPEQYSYSFHVKKKDYMPKFIFVSLPTKDTIIKKPIVLRSRKAFWYDSKKIDSTHIGMKVRDAIKKYKRDIDECLLWDEPPGKYFCFTAELADSSYALFTIPLHFSIERLEMKDILDLKITGFGITNSEGKERIIGEGIIRPY